MIGSIGVFALTFLCGAISFGALSPSEQINYAINDDGHNYTSNREPFNTLTSYYDGIITIPQLYGQSLITDTCIFIDVDADTQTRSNNLSATSIQYYDDCQETYQDLLDASSILYIYSELLGDTTITRILVPFDMPISYIEFSPNQDMTMAMFDASASNVGNMPSTYANTNRRNYYGLTYSLVFSTYEQYSLPSVGRCKFAEFCLQFPYTQGITSVDLDIHFCFDNGSSSFYFNQGYNNGYSDGHFKGYTEGYAEGIALIPSGNMGFMSLFTAIADTPIIFLKGLFSFDLFGVSVLTIILSLLTGMILLFVIKKVVK